MQTAMTERSATWGRWTLDSHVVLIVQTVITTVCLYRISMRFPVPAGLSFMRHGHPSQPGTDRDNRIGSAVPTHL
jgi:hypothetical protein